MKLQVLLLKISFVLLLLVGVLHTFFILIGGPEFPVTPDFIQMRHLMKTIRFDTGGGITRSMQDVMDGFNIIVSVFLITLPVLSWLMLGEIKENRRAVLKLTWVNLVSVSAFSLTSFALLAIGGTVIGTFVCLLLLLSSILKK